MAAPKRNPKVTDGRTAGEMSLDRLSAVGCGGGGESERWLAAWVGASSICQLIIITVQCRAWQVQTAFAALRATRRTLVYRLVALHIHPLVSSSLGSWARGGGASSSFNSLLLWQADVFLVLVLVRDPSVVSSNCSVVPPVRSSSSVYTRRLQLLQPPLFPFRPGLKADVQTTGRSINRIQVTTVSVAEDFMCLCGCVCVWGGGIHCRREPQTYQQRIHALIWIWQIIKQRLKLIGLYYTWLEFFGYCRIKLVIGHPKYWYKSF